MVVVANTGVVILVPVANEEPPNCCVYQLIVPGEGTETVTEGLAVFPEQIVTLLGVIL